MSRQPLSTIEEAQELAAAIAAVPGWFVVAVRGVRPGGPPRTSRRNHLSTYGGLPGVQSPSYRVRLVPPTIVAVTPGGRQVNVGSPARWEALRLSAPSFEEAGQTWWVWLMDGDRIEVEAPDEEAAVLEAGSKVGQDIGHLIREVEPR